MNLVGLLFILLWKDTLGNDQGFQCNYGEETLTDVICTCENTDSSTGTRVEPNAITDLDNLEISNCQSIQIQFKDQSVIVQEENEETEHFIFTLTLTVNSFISIRNLENLYLNYTRYGVRPKLNIENVTFVNLDSEETTQIIDWMGISHEELYFYLTIALGSISFICLFVIIPSIICCQSKEKCCSSCFSGPPGKSKKVARAESWRFDSSMYVNPQPRNTYRTARMSTHQLPYQLVSQRDTLQQQHRSQGQQNPTHIAQLLGRTTQFPMHIGLPSPTPTPGTDQQFDFPDEDFDNVSESSSFAYDPSHTTSTLPAAQKEIH